MQNALAQNTWFQRATVIIALLCVGLYAFANNYILLAVPFALAYLWLTFLNWKLAYWIMLFTIPASIQIELMGGVLSTSLPDEPMMWVLLGMFSLLFASNPKIIPQWWWRNPLVLIVFLQYIWMIVAVIFSEMHLISIKFALAKTWFLVSFFVLPIFIFEKKVDFKRGFLLLLIPMLVTILIIFYRHKTMGFNFRKIEKAIGGLYYNHVDYSTILSMFWPLLCVAIPLSKGVKWYWRLLLVLIMLFFLPATYLTYARAAMLAIVFAIVLGIAIRMRLANLIMPVFYALIIFLIGYMVRNNKYIEYRPDYNHTYMHFTFTDHMIATLRGQDMSSMERLYRWIAGARMSMDRPLTGVGPNAFYFYYKPYAVTSFRTWVSRNPEMSTTHNYFLYMLVEQGWPALILYAILVMVVIAQAQKTYHRFKDKYYKNITLGLAMMFGAGFINNFFSELLETHKVGALFYLSIALLVVMDHKSRVQEEKGIEVME